MHTIWHDELQDRDNSLNVTCFGATALFLLVYHLIYPNLTCRLLITVVPQTSSNRLLACQLHAWRQPFRKGPPVTSYRLCRKRVARPLLWDLPIYFYTSQGSTLIMVESRRRRAQTMGVHHQLHNDIQILTLRPL